MQELRPEHEARWKALFDRQQGEIGCLFSDGRLSNVWRVAMLWRIVKEDSPDAGMRSVFNTITDPKKREEVLGKHQLRKRKSLAKELGQEVAAVHRQVDEDHGRTRPQGMS